MVILFKNIYVLYIKIGLFIKEYNANINDFLWIELLSKLIFFIIIFKNVIIFVLYINFLAKIIYYIFLLSLLKELFYNYSEK